MPKITQKEMDEFFYKEIEPYVQKRLKDQREEQKKEFDRIYKNYHYMKSSAVKVGFVQMWNELYQLVEDNDHQ